MSKSEPDYLCSTCGDAFHGFSDCRYDAPKFVAERAAIAAQMRRITISCERLQGAANAGELATERLREFADMLERMAEAVTAELPPLNLKVKRDAKLRRERES